MTPLPTKPKVLVIEDEPKIAQLLSDYLLQANYEPHWVADGQLAVQAFESWQPELVLLDLMLPGKDGMQICKEIRKTSQVPIIMVTARVEEIDRLLGLEIGADDYICKPFSPREVIARVKTILRRVGLTTAESQSGPFCVNEQQMKIRIDGQALPLTSSEFRLLAALAARPEHVFSRDQLLNAAGDDLLGVSDRAIDSHIKNIRKKISAVRPGQGLIESVYGVGYRLTLG